MKREPEIFEANKPGSLGRYFKTLCTRKKERVFETSKNADNYIKEDIAKIHSHFPRNESSASKPASQLPAPAASQKKDALASRKQKYQTYELKLDDETLYVLRRSATDVWICNRPEDLIGGTSAPVEDLVEDRGLVAYELPAGTAPAPRSPWNCRAQGGLGPAREGGERGSLGEF